MTIQKIITKNDMRSHSEIFTNCLEQWDHWMVNSS